MSEANALGLALWSIIIGLIAWLAFGEALIAWGLLLGGTLTMAAVLLKEEV
jgi:hypothetical protein